jgi:hypothetical protein
VAVQPADGEAIEHAQRPAGGFERISRTAYGFVEVRELP